MNLPQVCMLVAMAVTVAGCLAIRRPKWEKNVHKMFRDEHGPVVLSITPSLQQKETRHG